MSPRQTILLIGEEGGGRRGIAKVLTADGYDVEQTDTCQAALERLRVARPAAVVTRCRLPDGSALDLLARVKGDGAGTPCRGSLRRHFPGAFFGSISRAGSVSSGESSLRPIGRESVGSGPS